MEEADREGREGRPRPMLVLVAGLARVTVEMSMPKAALVFVLVDMEAAAPPLPEETERQRDDDQSDRRFDATPGGLRQGSPDEQERQAEGDERRRVPDAPREAEQGARACVPSVRPGHERRDRGEVIGVGGMAEAEEQCDEENEGGPTFLGELRDRPVH
jgi:hypothetical protein